MSKCQLNQSSSNQGMPYSFGHKEGLAGVLYRFIFERAASCFTSGNDMNFFDPSTSTGYANAQQCLNKNMRI